MTFDEFARAALRELGVAVAVTESEHESSKSLSGGGAVFGIGAEASGTSTTRSKLRALGADKIDPWRLYLELRDLGRKVVVVLDEYDVVVSANATFHRGVAELMKTLADHSSDCDSRLVIVGIAQSAKLLLGRHESIERSAAEVYLHPLDSVAIYAFLASAEEELRFKFNSAVKDAIVDTSGGYPYFVHLVGLECVESMLKRDPAERVVNEHDYKVAVGRAVRRAFRAELRKYSNAMRSLSELDMAIVREIASLGRRDRNVTPEELERRVVFVTRLPLNDVRAAFERVSAQGLIFVTSTNRYIRFRDPLLAPFIRAVMLPELGPEMDVRQLSLFGSEGSA